MNAVGFHWIDYTVVAVYLAGMVAIGFVFAHRQKTTEDFFLAGRNMPWPLVMISVFASIASATTYIGVPGLAYSENISFMVGIAMMPVVAPIIILLFLPFYSRLRVTTSYEYVHLRFGPMARYTVAGLFVAGRIGWLGAVIYAPALAVSVVTDMHITTAILLMGLLGTLYTVLGGLAAVIWTDLAQFIVLVGGAVWVAIAVTHGVPGGVLEIFDIASDTGRLNLLEWRPRIAEMTVGVVAISYFFQFMHDYGVDQVTVQRLMATRDFKGMAAATMGNSILTFLILGLLGYIGLGLHAYSRTFPHLLPHALAADTAFPYFIVHGLPRGASGLLIAGIFAAAMSSVDSGINSLATVVVHDFIRPLRGALSGGAHEVRLARWLTFLFGSLATLAGLYASTIEGLIKGAQTFLGLFLGPVLALFLLGMLTRRGSFPGWIVGVVVALPLTVYLQRETPLHFIWYFPVSFAVCFLIGYAASPFFKRAPSDPALTVWGRNPS